MAINIPKRAGGYPNVPGIWNDDQIAAWKNVTEAVQRQKSFIFLQLWALGRTAVPQIAEAEGFELVSSSPVPIGSDASSSLESDLSTPKELAQFKIAEFIAHYVQPAKNATAAGFDGVEVRGASGYLIDQFTQDTCNRRQDKYGGSIENRSRFLLEVVSGIVDAIGADKVGLRLSPWQSFQGRGMEVPIPTRTSCLPLDATISPIRTWPIA
ncbi:hypothetical protein CNMCM5623_000836 [Aspergillus felis]|uniref:NADH:flavin oxidoreductase/NADH oxidase N-terminal domain-containing protein n=1 Tax=Aspergillus felis TaxID=1287682 RepID=A0A8H6UVG1_9EURO|nr:hypothetical protein CNMCM5623_000836 [Aspergillus felis]KAF7181165.1 hypothetical protein CNMCM7691_000294 [Aspergillus felis]